MIFLFIYLNVVLHAQLSTGMVICTFMSHSVVTTRSIFIGNVFENCSKNRLCIVETNVRVRITVGLVILCGCCTRVYCMQL